MKRRVWGFMHRQPMQAANESMSHSHRSYCGFDVMTASMAATGRFQTMGDTT